MITVFAVAFAVIVSRVNRQRRAADSIEQLGGTVFYDYAQQYDSAEDEWSITVNAKPPDHWITRWFGRDYRHKIVGVHGYAERYYTSPPGVFMSLGPARIETDFQNQTDEAIQSLRGLRLRFLDLSKTTITDRGLADLPDLVQTKQLRLADTAITDSGLKHLPRLRGLESVALWSVPVTRHALDSLQSACPKLEIWHHSTAEVTDNGWTLLRDL